MDSSSFHSCIYFFVVVVVSITNYSKVQTAHIYYLLDNLLQFYSLSSMAQIKCNPYETKVGVLRNDAISLGGSKGTHSKLSGYNPVIHWDGWQNLMFGGLKVKVSIFLFLLFSLSCKNLYLTLRSCQFTTTYFLN